MRAEARGAVCQQRTTLPAAEALFDPLHLSLHLANEQIVQHQHRTAGWWGEGEQEIFI